MRIDAIDKNLVVETEVTEPDLIWFNIEDAPFEICGVKFEEEEGFYTRMPREAAERVSTGVLGSRKFTTGGRVRFRTDSKFIAIKAVTRNMEPFSHMPLTAQSGFDLYRKVEGYEGGREMYYKSFIPPQGAAPPHSPPAPPATAPGGSAASDRGSGQGHPLPWRRRWRSSRHWCGHRPRSGWSPHWALHR